MSSLVEGGIGAKKLTSAVCHVMSSRTRCPSTARVRMFASRTIARRVIA
jgi:hypothetical protein